MSQPIQVAHGAITLTVIDGIPTTTSNQVAQHFGKRHDHVLRDIEALCEQLPVEFTAPNFGASDYTDSTGRKLPAYRLTRDGFTLLAMGFTGKKALAFKLAYIDAFNAMERQIHQAPPAAPVAQPLEQPHQDRVRQLKAMAGALVQAALLTQEAANTIAVANGGVRSALWLNPPIKRAAADQLAQAPVQPMQPMQAPLQPLQAPYAPVQPMQPLQPPYAPVQPVQAPYAPGQRVPRQPVPRKPSPEARFLADWQALEIETASGGVLPFCPCMGSDLYREYRRWCAQHGERVRRPQELIGLCRQQHHWDAGCTRSTWVSPSDRTYKVRKMVVPSEAAMLAAADQHPDSDQERLLRGYFETQTDWLTTGLFAFKEASLCAQAIKPQERSRHE